MEKARETGSPSSSPPVQPTNTSANTNAPKMPTDQEEVVMHVMNQPTSSPEQSSLARRGKKLGQVTQDPLTIVMINQYCPNLKKNPVHLAAEHLSGFAKFCEINKSTYETGAPIWPIFLLSILGLGEDETMRNKMEGVSQEDVQAICKELCTHRSDYENNYMKDVYQKLGFFATKAGCNTFLKFLLESSLIDPNANIHQGQRGNDSLFQTILWNSEKYNNLDCLKILLATENFVMNQEDLSDLQSFVQRAARQGNDVKFLIESGLLETDTLNDMLFYAVSKGQINTVKALVESGASINAIHKILRQAISRDSENPDYINTVKFVLQQLQQKGINICDKFIYDNGYESTPLIDAAAIVHMHGFTQKHVQIIKMLLEHGANVTINARGIDNKTALMHVMHYYPNYIKYYGYRWEIIKLLVNYGATLTADDYKILEQNSQDPLYTLRMYNFVQELLSKKEGSS